MQNKAHLVIVGSGIVGCSAAYHLTKLGWRDVLVIDKGDLYENDGSTSHAPGGVVPLSHSKLLTQMGIYSADLYRVLAPYSADRHTCHLVGQIELAISQERWADLIRLQGESLSFGAEAHLLRPPEVKEKLPWVDERAFVGGLFVPKGTVVTGAHVSGALAREAEATGGAKFVGQTALTDLEVQEGRVTAVLTDNPAWPRIECDHVLLCANIWAPAISEKIGFSLPLMAFEHQYVITEPLADLAMFDPHNKDHEIVYPATRELDSTMYYRQHWNRMGVGSYKHAPRMIHPRQVKKTAKHPFTPDDFKEAWQQAQVIMPALQEAKLSEKFNGLFAFSVDGYPIIGQSKVKSVWAAVASWITHAGGVGKSVAEWMTEGQTEWDMRQAHIRRFAPYQMTQAYIDVVCQKNYREVYDIGHPKQPLSTPRNVRLSPFHPRHQSLQASFTTFAGLELPNWYEENVRLLEHYQERVPKRTGWASRYWSPIQGVEHLATRENVALFDLTGLSIIEVRGRGALAFVNYLCSNQLNKAVGQVVYTTWLTQAGGVKRDLTVARLAEDCFWLFVGEGTLPQDLAWVQQHADGVSSSDDVVIITDISNSYTALGLWGPNARQVMQKVTTMDVSHEAFPYFTSQWLEIGSAPVFALRVSYAGELGWEIHIPMDQALPVWDKLWDAGREVEMVAAGSGAFDSLRLEKGYRLWGGDVHTEYNPYEAGLGWTVRLKKGDFLGREACLMAKKKGLQKKLCGLTFDDSQAVALGYEPIFSNGDCIGHVTTANYGYSLGKFIAYAYLPLAYTQVGTKLEMQHDGYRFAVTVCDDPLYDPKMVRLKA